MKVILEFEKMPDNCSDCELAVFVADHALVKRCSFTYSQCEQPDFCRNDDCPLKEVEEGGK